MKYFEYNTELTMEYEAVFLDIETTGLKKETALLTVLGCGYKKEGTLHIVQWFNDDAISEEAILSSFYDLMKSISGPIITFNGGQFDLPFLKTHFDYNDLPVAWLEERPGFDLYRFLRGYVSLLDLENGKQKAWEYYLGIGREDQLSGRTLISFYKKYLKEKKEEMESLILLHNKEDVEGLFSLMPLLSLEQLQKEEFEIIDLKEDQWMEKAAITFTIELKDSLAKSFSVTGNTGIFTMQDKRRATVTLPIIEDKLYHFYDNYQDYYYLPLEDRAIHKSIGSYVDKEHRKKASAKTCYVSEESVFLPIPENAKGYGFEVSFQKTSVLAAYKRNYESSHYYLNFNDLIVGDHLSDECRHYLGQIIQAIFLEKIRQE
ncbi:MAG: ribonuclease H-like domain-containing protein [Eubacteriales bacterium]|nr:ribonuclease H-like domain-containing protein [Eubacteriales bacterium]